MFLFSAVPMPNWTIRPCTFTLDSMKLFWNRPGGEQCCTNYVLQELKLCTTPDTQSNCMAREHKVFTNEFSMCEPRYTLPLSESRYRVKCLNKYGDHGSFSIPLHIKLGNM